MVECQDNLSQLERKVEDCKNPQRIRILDGPEETVEELMQKLEKVSLTNKYRIQFNSISIQIKTTIIAYYFKENR